MGAEAENINTDSEGGDRESSTKESGATDITETLSTGMLFGHTLRGDNAPAPQSPSKIWPVFSPKSSSGLEQIDVEKLLFQTPTKSQLRQLSRIRHVLIHYTSIDPVGDYSPSALEILDDRIKLDSLAAVLLSLLSNAHGAPLRALCRSLKLKGDALLHSVVNISEPNSHSISGEVSGAEVTIGDEEFLLERGVLLDSLSDTLLEPGQVGFYLLIAVGDAIVARVLVTPPRIGDGRALCAFFRQQQIPIQIFTLGAASPDTVLFAADAGISPELIYSIDSTLHLDSFLEERKPFVLVTTDSDCASYVGSHGSVALLAEREFGLNAEHVLEFSSFDLRGLTHVYAQARRLVRRERLLIGMSAVAALIVVGVLVLVLGS